MKTWTVYIRRNKVNNKVYVGITVKTPEQRAGSNGCHYIDKRHHTKFARAILKYGWKAFETTVIASNLNEETAKAYERFWISVFDSKNNGYNTTDGGDANPMHDQSVVSKRIGERRSEVARENMRNANRSDKTPILCRNVATGEKKIFKSMSEAARQIGVSKTLIYRVCNNVKGNKTAKGYECWYYTEASER